MDLDMLFTTPGYSLVANRILGFLSYKSIKTCREVSPIWKKFIDEQKFWRLDRFFSLIKKGWMVQETEDMIFNSTKKVNLLKKFPEWKKIIPHVKNQMSVSDIDKLIKGLELYFEKNHAMFPKITGCEDGDQEFDQFCPLHFAVHEGDFEFVVLMMLQTPFDVSKLKFKLRTCEGGGTISRRHRNCDTGDDPMKYWDRYTHYRDNFNILEKVANCGSIELINLILENAEEFEIKKRKNAIYAARKRPQVVKLLMKHCEFDKESLCHLGTNNLAHLAILLVDGDEPARKKIKTSHYVSSSGGSDEDDY